MKNRKTILRIAQWGQLTTLCLPVYLAQEAGWLKKADIGLQYILVGNADKIVNSVARNECDLAMSGPTMCALTEHARYDMKVVAAISDRAAVHGLTANPVIQTIGDPSDFAGLRIATAPRPSTAYAIMASLKQKNRRLLKNTKLFEAGIGQQIDAVRNGEADLYIDQEPYVSAAEAKGYRVVFSAAKMCGPLSFTSLYGRAEVLKAKQESIATLCNSIARACKMIYSDPERTEALAIKIFKGLPPAVIKASLTRLTTAQVWPKRPATSKEAWNNAIAMRRAIGFRFIRNPWRVVDNGFFGG